MAGEQLEEDYLDHRDHYYLALARYQLVGSVRFDSRWSTFTTVSCQVEVMAFLCLLTMPAQYTRSAHAVDSHPGLLDCFTLSQHMRHVVHSLMNKTLTAMVCSRLILI